MNNKELKDIFKLLDDANVNYMPCSEMTPVSLTSVPCGSPTELCSRKT